MASKKVPLVQLIDGFAAGVQDLAAMYSAEQSAASAEQRAQGLVNRLYAQNGLYITPHDIPSDTQTEFAAQSADAQLKKLQSDQISYATRNQVQEQEQQLLRDFKGRKVTFTLVDKSYDPFEAVWFNPQTGQPKTSLLKTRTISGIITDLSLEQNVVMLRPGFWQRRLNPDRKLFLVYIINPATLAPTVQAS